MFYFDLVKFEKPTKQQHRDIKQVYGFLSLELQCMSELNAQG